ncbi:MAG: PEP-CTERM sorting domain-containing protein [Betaproteobacteria bacterium]
MKTSKILCAAVFATAMCGAHADSATWVFRVDGSGVFALGGIEGCSPAGPDSLHCPHDVRWTGLFTVKTASDADGTYDAGEVSETGWVPGGILSVYMGSNVGGTSVDAQDSPGVQFFPGVYPYAVTIVDHQVIGIEWTSEDMPEGTNFLQVDGFNVQYQTGSYHGTYADVTGTLTAIPEPGGVALFMVGLAAVTLGRRRTRRPPGEHRIGSDSGVPLNARKTICAAALALTSFGAQAANATWMLALNGSGQWAAGGTEGCSPFNPDQCVQDGQWLGFVVVETAGSADGTYTGDGLLEIRVDSNFAIYDFTSFPFGPTWPVAPSVTITDGAVSSLSVSYNNDGQEGYPPDYFTVNGLAASYYTAGYHTRYADMRGVLSSIPEPGPASTVLAGLGLLAGALVRARERRIAPHA